MSRNEGAKAGSLSFPPKNESSIFFFYYFKMHRTLNCSKQEPKGTTQGKGISGSQRVDARLKCLGGELMRLKQSTNPKN